MHAAAKVKMEQEKIALIKKQMDAKLMMLEAIDAAKACYSRRYIREMRMTTYGPNDKGADIL